MTIVAPPGAVDADTLPKLLIHHARTRPATPALRHKRRAIWRTWSWSEHAREVAAVAALLDAAGVAAGDAVAVLGDNRPELYRTMLAAQCLGATAVPLSPLADSDVLKAVLTAFVPAVMVAETEAQADALQRAAAQCGVATTVLKLAAPGDAGSTVPTLEECAARHRMETLDWLAAKVEAGRPEDVAVVLHSAGVQAEPRPVPLTQAELLRAGRSTAEALRLTAADVALAFLPIDGVLDHGMVVAPALVAGHCLACPESPETIESDLREVAPTVLVAPPRAFELIDRRVRRHLPPERPLRRLAESLGASAFRLLVSAPLLNTLGLRRVRAAVVSGDLLDPDCVARLRAVGLPVRHGYGLVEAAGLVALEPAGGGALAPLPGVAVLTPDNDVLVRCDDFPWIPTGDAGRFVPGQGLTLLGRRASQVRIGERNLDPAVVEAHLRGHPEIDRACVFVDAAGHLTAAVTLDAEAVGRWAEHAGIAIGGNPAAVPAVRDLIEERVGATNGALCARAGDPAVRRVVIASPRDGTAVTAAGFVRRHLWTRRYAAPDLPLRPAPAAHVGAAP